MTQFSFELCARDFADLLRGVPARGEAKTNPILGCALIELKNGEISCQTANNKMSLIKRLPSAKLRAHEGQGSVAIAVDHILSLAETFSPIAAVVIEVDGLEVRFLCCGADFSLRGMNAADFPPMLRIEEDAKSFDVDADDLSASMRRVRASMCVSDTRMSIFGMNMRSRAGRVELCCTDGVALSISPMRIDEPDVNLVMPQDTVDFVSKIFTDGRVNVKAGKNSVGFEGQNMTLVSLLVDTIFADYQRILDQDDGKTSTDAQVSRVELSDALRRLNIIAKDEVGVLITINEHGLHLQNDIMTGRGESGNELVAGQTQGEQRRICVSARAILETLNQSKSELVTLSIFDNTRVNLETADGFDVVMARRSANA